MSGIKAVLATTEQISAEKVALRIIDSPHVVDALEKTRETLLADPAANSAEGRDSLDL